MNILRNSMLLIAMLLPAICGEAIAQRNRYGSWSPDGNAIVFESDRDGDFEIYVMQIGQSDWTQLTFSPGRDGLATYSPNGKQILFISKRSGEEQLFVMDTTGKNLKQLTQVEGFVDGSAWSPDGKHIVFDAGFRGGGKRWLYLMEASGEHVRKLLLGDHAVWSPDGKKMAYCSGEPDGYLGIYMYDLETGMHHRISRLDDPDFIVDWSPDGERLVFCSSRIDRGKSTEIYLMDPDGANQTRLTFSPKDDAAPRFSPDGRRILFTSWRTGREQLFVMDKEGGNLLQITGVEQP